MTRFSCRAHCWLRSGPRPYSQREPRADRWSGVRSIGRYLLAVMFGLALGIGLAVGGGLVLGLRPSPAGLSLLAPTPLPTPMAMPTPRPTLPPATLDGPGSRASLDEGLVADLFERVAPS